MPKLGQLLKTGVVDCPGYGKIAPVRCADLRKRAECGYCEVCGIHTRCPKCGGKLWLKTEPARARWECRDTKCGWRSESYAAKLLEETIAVLHGQGVLKRDPIFCERRGCDVEVSEPGKLCRSCSAMSREAAKRGMTLERWLKVREDELSKRARGLNLDSKRKGYDPVKEAERSKSEGRTCPGFPASKNCGVPITNKAKLCKACDSARRSAEAKADPVAASERHRNKGTKPIPKPPAKKKRLKLGPPNAVECRTIHSWVERGWTVEKIAEKMNRGVQTVRGVIERGQGKPQQFDPKPEPAEQPMPAQEIPTVPGSGDDPECMRCNLTAAKSLTECEIACARKRRPAPAPSILLHGDGRAEFVPAHNAGPVIRTGLPLAPSTAAVDLTLSCTVSGSAMEPEVKAKATIVVEADNGFKLVQTCKGELSVVASSLRKVAQRLEAEADAIIAADEDGEKACQVKH